MYKSLFTATLVVLFALLMTHAQADNLDAVNYMPDDLFVVDYYVLPNGMKVTLKATDKANNVSIRMKVDYGSYDEHCGQRETAHFLEHLIFTGTSQFTETQLDEKVSAWGASWNAATYDDKTVYEMDIHSIYQQEALSLLHHILTDSQISEKNVNTSRDIIHRESGGKPSLIKRWSYRHGMQHSAGDFMREDQDQEHCREWEMADAISRPHIIAAYNTWYVPNNMHLFIVGKLSPDIKADIEKTFSPMLKKSVPVRLNKKPLPYASNEYHNHLNEIYGDESHLNYKYLIINDDDYKLYYAMMIYETYLSEKIYEYIRTRQGLSYSPIAGFNYIEFYRALNTLIDVNNEDIEKGIHALKDFERDVISKPVTQKDFDRIKKQILIAESMDDNPNSSMADYFIDDLDEFERHGKYLDMEEQFKAVTIDDVNNFYKKNLRAQKILVVNEPLLSTSNFMILVIGLPLLLIGILLFFIWHKVKGRRNSI